MEHISKILMKEFVTHDTLRFIAEKPENYKFAPGQATEVSINKEEWKDKKRPFTFTSLSEDKVLEFTIKIYPTDGVTQHLSQLKAGDELILRDIFGSINYKGPGVFIAGGAGVTPFIAILRQLKEENKLGGNSLIFSNKLQKDIILEKEFKEMFGDKVIFTLTRENNPNYNHGYINKEFLQKHLKNFDIDQHFYICGPMQFIVDIKKALDSLGVQPESVVIEM